MDRLDLDSRAAAVLEMLEHRAETHPINHMQGWLDGPYLQDEIGINWKVGLNKLEHKTKPLLGKGFKIERAAKRDGSKQWRYRLVAYPLNWDSKDRVDLVHIQEETKQPKPIPRGQQGLFSASAVG